MLTNDRTVFERALIYHDSSAVAFFGEQLQDVESHLFCGNEYRTNEVSSAILRVQMRRLDGILADLRRNKRTVMEQLANVCSFIPSNDIEGDCATTLALRFDSECDARAFAEKCTLKCTLPIDTGKHVYTNWTPVMQKVGALHPLMDPFKMEANRDIIPDYTMDMCPRTLELLARTVYISVNPDWTAQELDEAVAAIRAAV